MLVYVVNKYIGLFKLILVKESTDIEVIIIGINFNAVEAEHLISQNAKQLQNSKIEKREKTRNVCKCYSFFNKNKLEMKKKEQVLHKLVL